MLPESLRQASDAGGSPMVQRPKHPLRAALTATERALRPAVL